MGSPSEGTVFFYVIVGLAGLTLAWWLVRSPVLRAILRGRGTDPGQFGTWQDHLEDIGLGPSWRSDGSGGRRETQIFSKHTRRR
jgi:hypothetical protein